jgi:hypothetical protein
MLSEATARQAAAPRSGDVPLAGPVLAGDVAAMNALAARVKEIGEFLDRIRGEPPDLPLDFREVLRALGLPVSDTMTEAGRRRRF